MKHKLNKDYFKTIDTENKAYWLGFIAADGCIYKMSKTAYRFQINLKADDINHLIAFNNEIESDYDIITKAVGKSEACQLKIASKEFTEHLIALGITPRKSLTIQMPELRDDLYKHFIRGYFDGDGCITYSKRANKDTYRYKFSIIGGEPMLEAINNKMNLDLSIYDINHSEAVDLSTANKNKIIAIYDYLYKDATIYLESKKEKFEEVLSLFAVMQSKEQSELTGNSLEP